MKVESYFIDEETEAGVKQLILGSKDSWWNNQNADPDRVLHSPHQNSSNHCTCCLTGRNALYQSAPFAPHACCLPFCIPATSQTCPKTHNNPDPPIALSL